MAIGEDLSVRISAATQSFERSMEEAQDSLNSVRNASATTASALQGLQGRANEVGDELGRTQRKASSASRSFVALTASTNGLSVAFGTLSTVTAASLVPAIAALSTALVPLTATLGAVAAAASGVAAGFGAVIGTGIFAYGEQLAEQNEERLEQLQERRQALIDIQEETGSLTREQRQQLRELDRQIEKTEEATTVMGALSQELQPVKDQLRETGLAIGEQFVPLIRDAIDALPAFIRRMEDALGPLQPFADALRDAGQVAFRVIPEITEQIMDMGRNALPTVRDLGSVIAENAVPALEAMEDTAARVIPMFSGLEGNIIPTIQALNEFGIAVLDNVVEGVGNAVTILSELIEETQEVAAIINQEFNPAISETSGTLRDAIPTVEETTAAIENISVIVEDELIPGLRSAQERFEELKDQIEPVREELEPLTEQFEELNTTQQAAAVGGTALLATNLDKVASVVSIVSGALVGLASVVSVGGSLISGFTSLAGVVASAGTTLGSLAASLTGGAGATAALSSLSVATGGVAAAIAGIGAAYATNFGQVRTIINTAVGQTVNPLLDELRETVGAIGTAIGAVTKAFVGGWKQIDQVVVPILKTVANVLATTLGGAIETTGDALEVILNLIQLDFAEAWEGLQELTVGTMQNIGQWLQTSGASIMSEAIDALAKTITAGLQAALSIIGVLEGALINALNWVENDSGKIIGNFALTLGDALTNFVFGLPAMIIDAVQTAIDWIATAPDILLEFANALVGGLTAVALDIIGIISDGINAAISWLQGAPGLIMDLADALGDALEAVGTAIGAAIVDAINKAIPNKIEMTTPEINIPHGPTIGGETLSASLPNNPVPVPGAQTGGLIEQTGLLMAHAGERVVPASQVTDRGEVTVNGGGPTEVRVSVEGDTGVVRDVTAEVIEDQRRRINRNSGESPNITR